MKKPCLTALSLLVSSALLSACAASPSPVAAAAPPSNVTASASTGVVASVRVSSSTDPGVAAVLAALHEPAPAQAIQRDEVVILGHGGNAVSTIPDGPAPALQPGDHVSVITGDTTSLAQQN